MLYIGQKTDVLINRKDSEISTATQANMFDHSKNFTAKDNFYVAAALTSYYETDDYQEDETLGYIQFYSYSWGEDNST